MPTADEIIEFNANNKKKGWCRLGFPFWFLDNSLFQSILKESFVCPYNCSSVPIQ